jgi:hypothetical protein
LKNSRFELSGEELTAIRCDEDGHAPAMVRSDVASQICCRIFVSVDLVAEFTFFPVQ